MIRTILVFQAMRQGRVCIFRFGGQRRGWTVSEETLPLCWALLYILAHIGCTIELRDEDGKKVKSGRRAEKREVRWIDVSPEGKML
jgi:hypothetical protein